MIGDIRKHLEKAPFMPFTIHMGDGRAIHVPTRDHIALTPLRVIVTHDDNSWDVLPGLLMAGLTVDATTNPEPNLP